MGNTDGTLTINTSVDTSGVTKGLKNISKMMSSFKTQLAFILGYTGFLMLGKDTLQAASDLAEYRNVAINTFKDLTDSLDDFTDNITAVNGSTNELLKGVTEVYGMSRLTATQAASSYMAMGNSIGVTREQAADMAIELTKLVGDFASFYNLSHERARTALAAVYTGETETMKQYGIILTEVNLQQFAYEQGITKSIKKMSAAEKTILRYNYIMKATADAQGDFARTANQTANQFRLIKENFKELQIVIGTGLKVLFTPVLQYLNAAITKFIEFSNVVGKALSKIFGIKFEKQVYVVDEALEGASTAMEDLGDTASDTGKKIKRVLAPFDELNVIAKKNSSSSGSGDDVESSLGALSDGIKGHVESIWEQAKSSINNLSELGSYISDSITKSLLNIDWKKIYANAESLGKNIADFINGLVTPEMFSAFGRTIASGINASVITVFTIGDNLHFEVIGEAISSGINSFFKTFRFDLFGKTLYTWASGILDALIVTLETLNWFLIGQKIGQTLEQLDIGTILLKAIRASLDLIKGALTSLFSVTLTAPLQSALIGLFVVPKLFSKLEASILGLNIVKTFNLFRDSINTTSKTAEKSIATLTNKFGRFTTSLIKDFGTWKKLFKNIGSTFKDVGKDIKYVFTSISPKSGGDIVAGFQLLGTSGKKLFTNLGANLNEFSKSLSKTGKTALTAVGGFVGFAGVQDAIDGVVSGTKDAGQAILQVFGSTGIATLAMTAAWGVPAGIIVGLVTAGVGAIVGVISGIQKKIDQISGETLYKALTEPGGVSITELTENLNARLEQVFKKASGSFEYIAEKSSSLKSVNENIESIIADIKVWTSELQSGAITQEEYMSKLSGAYTDLTEAIQTKLDALKAIIFAGLGEDSPVAQELERMGVSVEAVSDEVVNNLSDVEKELADLGKQLEEAIKSGNSTEVNNIIKKIGQLNGKLTNTADISKDMSKILSKRINLADFLSADSATVDIDKLNSNLSELHKNVDDYISQLEENSDAFLEAIKPYVSDATYQQLVTAQANYLKNAKKSIGSEVDDYVRTIHNGLVDNMENVLNEAKETFNNSTMLQMQYRGNFDLYAQDIIRHYKEDVMNPVAESMRTGIGDLSDTASNWSAQANQNIVNKLFTVETGFGYAQIKLASNWKSIIEGVKKPSVVKAIEAAKNILAGFSTGMQDTSKLTGLKKVVYSVSNTILDRFKDSDALDIHSPSRKTAELGKFLVEGLANGISSTSISNNIITGMSSKLLAQMNTVISVINKAFNTLQTSIPQSFNNITPSLSIAINKMGITIRQLISSMTKSVSTGFSGMGTSLVSAFTGISSKLKTPLNSILTVVQSMINKIISGINSMVYSINRVKFTAPKWIPLIGGKSFSLNATGASSITIPKLAKGAVIPPNKEFMAILGDQKHGTNIETPLDTMIEAFKTALADGSTSQGDINLVVQLDGDVVYNNVVKRNSERFRRTGSNPLFAY